MKLSKRSRLKNIKPTIKVIEDASMRNSAAALFANIRFLEVDERVANIVVTSSVPNEGKSTVAVALAVAIGAAGKTCLLVEADMRRRSLAATLGLSPRYTLGALLTGECCLDDAIVKTDYPGLSFLGSDPGVPAPEALLDSKRFTKLMEKLKSEFDYVIYDTPPLGAFPDAAVVAGKADGTLLLLREDYTDRSEAVRSLEALKLANARVLGAVLNGQTPKNASSYGYSYSYVYQYAYKEVPASDPRAQAQLAKQKLSRSAEQSNEDAGDLA